MQKYQISSNAKADAPGKMLRTAIRRCAAYCGPGAMIQARLAGNMITIWHQHSQYCLDDPLRFEFSGYTRLNQNIKPRRNLWITAGECSALRDPTEVDGDTIGGIRWYPGDDERPLILNNDPIQPIETIRPQFMAETLVAMSLQPPSNYATLFGCMHCSQCGDFVSTTEVETRERARKLHLCSGSMKFERVLTASKPGLTSYVITGDYTNIDSGLLPIAIPFYMLELGGMGMYDAVLTLGDRYLLMSSLIQHGALAVLSQRLVPSRPPPKPDSLARLYAVVSARGFNLIVQDCGIAGTTTIDLYADRVQVSCGDFVGHIETNLATWVEGILKDTNPFRASVTVQQAQLRRVAERLSGCGEISLTFGEGLTIESMGEQHATFNLAQ